MVIPHEPSNLDSESSSLVFAALPDDMLFEIIHQAAVQDTATALALAMCSKAVGRAAERELYASVCLRSISAIRRFTFALETKERRILARVSALRLAVKMPSSLSGDAFWALVSERCPNIDTLAIWDADLKALLRPEMRIRPRQLSFFSNTIAHLARGAAPITIQEPVDDACLWTRLTHLYIAERNLSNMFGFIRVRPEALLHVTHFASSLTRTPDLHWVEVGKIPSLRVCVFLSSTWAPAGFLQGRMPVDRLDRIVVLNTSDAEDAEGYWKLAEEKIAERRLEIS
ncbi:hypothetical protein HMN09_01140100 [Mycena chlorophos]|uniref:Uncharacterized protein n=1 Tax=Mycena chlorophos TaxID=658473 RepID=A0A8H6S982_MYCCL|nr:hypothetical protein HMN09_01140100 [Mycena chlorophos]